MRPIKILNVITRLEQGGAPSIVISTLNHLDKERFKVKLATGLASKPEEDLIEEAKNKGIELIIIPQLVREVSLFNDLIALLKLIKIIRRDKFDIVHTHESKAGILGRVAGKLAGVPVIIHSPHGHIFYGYFGYIKTTIFILLERFTALFTDKIITLTKKEIEEHLKVKIGNRDKFTFIYNGIELDKFEKVDVNVREKRGQLSLPLDVSVVATVARLVPVKGHKYLIDAAAEVVKSIPQARFLFIGDGKLREELQEQAENLGLSSNILFLGWRKDVLEILPIIDLFVLPSINEGLGMVLVEAYAFGKPVVATNVGGIPEVVEDKKTGLLTPPKDSKKLAQAIIELLEDPKRAKKMGEEGKKKVITTFGVDVMVEKIERLYEELIRGKK